MIDYLHQRCSFYAFTLNTAQAAFLMHIFSIKHLMLYFLFISWDKKIH